MAIDVHLTRVFNETLDAWLEGKRRCLHEGGTSSSKTYSILQFLIKLAEETKEPLLTSVVSESLPHLKKGCITDFFNILGETPDKNNPYYKVTETAYQRPEWKGKIEFFGADDAGKVRGPRRDILFINEGNNIPWETARNLDVRTKTFTLVDWNPVSEFWVHEYESGGDILPGWIVDKEHNAYVHSTYLDAKDVLPQSVIDRIEANKNDPNWWRIYGLGLIGKIEGLVYPGFDKEKHIIDRLPEGDYFYGLDFGYTDPTVLTKHVILGSKLYSQEILWGVNWTNDVLMRNMDLAKVRKYLDEITADAEDPKSIKELSDKGYNIKPSEKGKDSVKYGILKVNEYERYWTRDSVNCIKEELNFRYISRIIRGREVLTDETTHFFSHGMDSRRYPVTSYVPAFTGVLHPAINY